VEAYNWLFGNVRLIKLVTSRVSDDSERIVLLVIPILIYNKVSFSKPHCTEKVRQILIHYKLRAFSRKTQAVILALQQVCITNIAMHTRAITSTGAD